MTWSNKKADCGNHIDRISDLPSHIIDDILRHLDMVEQVRTSILSRKWRYMWISVPQLCFGESFFRKCAHLDDYEICRAITKVLLAHDRPIYNFTLKMPITSTIIIECLNSWFPYLSRSGIKDLKLVNHEALCQMPSHFFSCQHLTYCLLYRFKMSVPPLNFSGFKRLLDLHLDYISFESGAALQRLVSGCPLLQGLTLLYCSGFECIDFSAPTLKVLKIFSYRVIKSICLKRANNLIDLTLKDNWYNREGCPISHLINFLPKIQRLVLGASYNKTLSVGTIPLMLRRSFSSLEYLKLFLNLDQTETLRYIVRLLESAPNLVELVIQEGSYSYFDAQVPYDSAELKCSSWCLSQLRTVKITVRDDRLQLAVSLIRLILANSSSLETLTFCVGIRSQLDESILSCISQDLLLMERASPRAKTVFLHGDSFYDGFYDGSY